MKTNLSLRRISLVCIFFFLFSFPLLAQEKIELTINGEVYEKDMPTNVEDLQELVRGLTEMYNERDTSYNDYVKTSEKGDEIAKEKIAALEKEIKELQDAIEKLKKDAKKVEKDANSLIKRNTLFTSYVTLGPALGFGNEFDLGTHFGVGFDYRIFRNFHIGPMVDCNIFTKSDTRKLDLSISLFLGYSFF